MLVILEDWFLSFSAEFYDTLAYLFDVTDEIIVHSIHYVVLKVGPETELATLSECLGAMQALRPLLDVASKLLWMVL